MLLVAVALTFGVQPASAATLKADYRFAGTRDSSCCGAQSLVDLGPGVNGFAGEVVDGSARQVLAFPRGNGLSFSSGGLVSPGSYSMVVLFRFEEVGGYRRITDVKEATLDTGVYSLIVLC